MSLHVTTASHRLPQYAASFFFGTKYNTISPTITNNHQCHNRRFFNQLNIVVESKMNDDDYQPCAQHRKRRLGTLT